MRVDGGALGEDLLKTAADAQSEGVSRGVTGEASEGTEGSGAHRNGAPKRTTKRTQNRTRAIEGTTGAEAQYDRTARATRNTRRTTEGELPGAAPSPPRQDADKSWRSHGCAAPLLSMRERPPAQRQRARLGAVEYPWGRKSAAKGAIVAKGGTTVATMHPKSDREVGDRPTGFGWQHRKSRRRPKRQASPSWRREARPELAIGRR